MAAAVFIAAATLSACSSDGEDRGRLNLPFTNGDNGNNAPVTQEGIGVNAFLWRATLDTLSFMPLASADPWGGVIITDWYVDPARPNERFKATVYILDTRLRADALNVSVFRQTNAGGSWVDATVSPDTGLQIENAILTRARQLRLSTLNEDED
ncbi:MAG: DUF3576 domain-containing protein [Hyphomonadaceae bacterium]